MPKTERRSPSRWPRSLTGGLAPVSNPPSRRAVYTSVEFEMICVAAAMVWWMQNHECQPGRSDLVTLPKGREGAHDLPRRCST